MARAPAAPGGELAHAMARDGADLGERVGGVREESQGRDQRGRDEQRLSDLGVADRLCVRLGAVVRQIEPGDGGEPLES